jgi:hypothetical protein
MWDEAFDSSHCSCDHSVVRSVVGAVLEVAAGSELAYRELAADSHSTGDDCSEGSGGPFGAHCAVHHKV